MQIGCSAPISGPMITPDSLLRMAAEAETLGFDYVTVSDHVMIPKSIASRCPYSESGEFPSGAGAGTLANNHAGQWTLWLLVDGMSFNARGVVRAKASERPVPTDDCPF